jgi:hypothetical protein
MRPGTQTILLAASLVLITTAIRLPLLPIPLERDEGEYAYIAWRLGYDELPYRDWFDQKPPAVFYVYRLALMLPFEPIRAIHFVALLFSATSACALFFLGLRFMDRFWAWLAGALFALLAVDPSVQGTAANTELFMLCPLILSQIAFVTAVNRQKRVDRSRLYVQAGGDCELAPHARTLSDVRSGRKQMARCDFIRRLVSDGSVNGIGLRGSVLLRPRRVARFCGERLHT